jgi:hypothetical protein
MPKYSRMSKRAELQAEFEKLRRRIQKADGKDPVAVAIGRRGGLKGGRALNDRLTPEQKRASASRAAKARWSREPE